MNDCCGIWTFFFRRTPYIPFSSSAKSGKASNNKVCGISLNNAFLLHEIEV
jgi:hypothetical protein